MNIQASLRKPPAKARGVQSAIGLIKPRADILLIEDDPAQRERLCELLQISGTHVEVAMTCTHAIGLASAGAHKVVLLSSSFVMPIVGFAQALRKAAPAHEKLLIALLRYPREPHYEKLGQLPQRQPFELLLNRPLDLPDIEVIAGLASADDCW